MKTKIMLVGVVSIIIGAFLTGLLSRILAGDTQMYLRMLGGYIALGVGGYIVRWGIQHD